MKIFKFQIVILGVVLVILSFAFQNCANETTSLPGTVGETGTLTNEERTNAVNQTAATNETCTPLGDFYWEIGDGNGALGSGSIGTTYTRTTEVPIASASKFVFGAFMIQLTNGNLTEVQKSALRMLSGYTGQNPSDCVTSHTISDCLNAGSPGPNYEFDASKVGKFNYDGAHDQFFATDSIANGGLNIGAYTAADLTNYVMSVLNINAGFYYNFPCIAGGIRSSPAQFAIFLQAIVSGKLLIHDYLGADPVCTLPGQGECTAKHYSYNHWVEDDGTSDGAFSSAGAFGFYPWVSADKTKYGIIARDSNEGHSGANSAKCGFQLRKAWETGIAQ